MGNEIYQNTVEEVYVAYYGRPAEASGLAFWEDAVARVGGKPSALINDFGTSVEATQFYAGMNISQQINKIYQLMFNRDAEPTGLNYWVDLVNRGGATPATIMLEVLNGAQANDKAIIDNKLAAANYFTNDIAANASHADWYTKNSDTVRSWLSKIDGTATSLTQAKTDLAKFFSAISSVPSTPTDPLLSGYHVTSSSVTNQLVDGLGTAVPVTVTAQGSMQVDVVTTPTGDLVFNHTSTSPITVVLNLDALYNNGVGPYASLTFNGGSGTSNVVGGFGDNVLIGGSGGEQFTVLGGKNYIKPGQGHDMVYIEHPQDWIAGPSAPGYPKAPDGGTTVDFRIDGGVRPTYMDSDVVKGFHPGLDKFVLDSKLAVSASTMLTTNQGSPVAINTDSTGLVIFDRAHLGLDAPNSATNNLAIQGSHGVYLLDQWDDGSGVNSSVNANLYYYAPGDSALTLVATLSPNNTSTFFHQTDFIFG